MNATDVNADCCRTKKVTFKHDLIVVKGGACICESFFKNSEDQNFDDCLK